MPLQTSEEVRLLRDELACLTQQLQSAHLGLNQRQQDSERTETILQGEVVDARNIADSLGLALAKLSSEAGAEASAIATAEVEQCRATANNLHRQKFSAMENQLRSEIISRDQHILVLSTKHGSEHAALKAAAQTYHNEAREAVSCNHDLGEQLVSLQHKLHLAEVRDQEAIASLQSELSAEHITRSAQNSEVSARYSTIVAQNQALRRHEASLS
jgi:hypothetical protein